MRRALLSLLPLVLVLAACEPPAGSDPPLTVPAADLDAALACPASFTGGRQPVLLVHGTFVTPEENWSWNYGRALPARGYDVCTVRLPARATGDIQVASEYVVHAVRVIAERSGREVDVLGHSQGGLEPRWALRWWPSLRSKVDDLVTLGSPHHGTVVADAATTAGCPPACWQMRRAARFIAALNSGDETPDGVDHTSIYTLTDELVQPTVPTATAALAGARNVLVQDLCPGRPVDHVGLASDAAVHSVVMDALTRSGPADPARFNRSTCAQVTFDGVAPSPLFEAGVAALSAGSTMEGEPTATAEPPLADYAQ